MENLIIDSKQQYTVFSNGTRVLKGSIVTWCRVACWKLLLQNVTIVWQHLLHRSGSHYKGRNAYSNTTSINSLHCTFVLYFWTSLSAQMVSSRVQKCLVSHVLKRETQNHCGIITLLMWKLKWLKPCSVPVKLIVTPALHIVLASVIRYLNSS